MPEISVSANPSNLPDDLDPNEDNFTAKVEYPDGQGLPAFRFLQLLRKELDSDDDDDDDTSLRDALIEGVLATGDPDIIDLLPEFGHGKKSIRSITKDAKARAAETTNFVAMNASVSATEGVNVDITFTFTWAKGHARMGIGALRNLLSDKTITAIANELVVSGDESAVSAYLAAKS